MLEADFADTPTLENSTDTIEQTDDTNSKQFNDEWYLHDVIKQKQQDYHAVIIRVPFGDTDSQHLKDIARLSRMYDTGEIRTSLDQNFIIPWVHSNDLKAIYEELHYNGFITKEKTFLNIVSCKDKETFNEWINRYNQDKLIEELLVYSYLPEYERSPEFYYDYGMEEPFTIKDIGKGECAGGVVDTIEIYLNRAETKAMDADTYAIRGLENKALEQAQSAITYAIQALLIMQGEDPEVIGTDLKNYIDKLYRDHIIDEQVINLYSNLFAQTQINNIKNLIKDLKKSILLIRRQTESFDKALLSGGLINKKVEVKMTKQVLDLKGVKCPYNYVKAKIKLEELTSGEELEIHLDEGEPIANVPRSLEDDGHTIVAIEKLDDTHFRLVVRKS